MAKPSDEASALWNRKELVHVEGRVLRVSDSFVSIQPVQPYRAVTVAWSEPVLRVGDAVVIAGQSTGRPPHSGLQPFVVQIGGWLRKQLVLVGRPVAEPTKPTTPQPWVAALVRHGLLEREDQVTQPLYGSDPVNVLVQLYAPRALVGRGFVHYDWKWMNDTEDLVADLAAIAGAPGSFTLVSAGRDCVELEVRTPDGQTLRERCDAEEPQLVAACMNGWLEKLGVERRIWLWDSGNDRWAFLGRSPDELAAMKTDGLLLEGVTIAGEPDAPSSATEQDWSGV